MAFRTVGVIAVAFCVLGASALAQGSGETGNPKSMTSAPGQITGAIAGGPAAAAAGCVSMSAAIVESGHRWNINSQNSCGRVVSCSVNASLKTSTGQTTSISCTPSLPTGSTTGVCSSYSSNTTWTSVIGGTFSCQ